MTFSWVTIKDFKKLRDYKNLAVIIKKTAEKYQLPYHVNKTFFGAVYQHALMLKSLGKPKKMKFLQLEFSKNNKLVAV